MLIIKSGGFQGKWAMRFDNRQECLEEFTG